MKRGLAVGLVVVAIVAGGSAGWGVSRINRHDKHAAGRSKAPVGAPVQIIDYVTRVNPDGILIDQPSQVDQLAGTSADFKQFVATNVQKILDDTKCNAATGFTIEKYATDGYAIGGVNDCGGYAAVWGVKDGVWKELIGTQDIWYCAELHKDGVPQGLINDGKCYDQTSGKVVQYAG